jgi:hypothetical protein
MKSHILLGSLAAVALLAGCATTQTDVHTEVGYVDKITNNVEFVGSYQTEIVKTVTWASKSKCSVFDFVTTITSRDTSIHDIMNIRAEETTQKESDGKVTDVLCRYWGIAVRYTPVVKSGQACAQSAPNPTQQVYRQQPPNTINRTVHPQPQANAPRNIPQFTPAPQPQQPPAQTVTQPAAQPAQPAAQPAQPAAQPAQPAAQPKPVQPQAPAQPTAQPKPAQQPVAQQPNVRPAAQPAVQQRPTIQTPAPTAKP